MKRVLGSLLLLVLLLALGAGAAAWWLARGGRAARDGALRVPGLHAPVEVRWDRFGMPHLKGDSGRDLALALGFLHANDRMPQLELGRRAAAGRLSEVFGEATVEMDVEARTLRLRHLAEATWTRLGPESRAWFEAYAAGVNAWLASRGDDLPPTLRLFAVKPEPWTPVDSLGFVFLMARDLSFWQGRPEELRYEWLRRLGPERLRDLLGEPGLHVPDGLAAMVVPRTGAAQGRGSNPADGAGAIDAAVGASAATAPDLPPGSNNWALGATRTADGRPLVANDLHLPMRLPGLWYQAHFRAPDYEAAGITLAGVPGVIVGQSRDLAWALTNNMMDDHDLFPEELDDDGGRVRRGERWVPVERERVEIGVRWGEPVALTLGATDRGPLLPADPARALPARSLTWSASLQGDALAAFLHLARARRVADVPAGIAGFVCPAQNLVVADRDGGLLHVVLGRLPRRLRGDGRLPAPSADPSYGCRPKRRVRRRCGGACPAAPRSMGRPDGGARRLGAVRSVRAPARRRGFRRRDRSRQGVRAGPPPLAAARAAWRDG